MNPVDYTQIERTLYLLLPPRKTKSSTGPPPVNAVPQNSSISFEATVMFCDMRGSSYVTENLSRAESIGIFRGFLNNIAKIIIKNGGRVRQIIGDRLLAFFPVPVSITQRNLKDVKLRDYGRALQASKEINAFIKYIFRPVVGERYGLELSVGKGIDRGRIEAITTGLTGNPSTQEAIWVGLCVPTASKMCDACPDECTIVSRTIYNGLPLDWITDSQGSERWRAGTVRIGEKDIEVYLVKDWLDESIYKYLERKRKQLNSVSYRV